MFHSTHMLLMYLFSMNPYQEFACLQGDKGLPEREGGSKAHAKQVFEIHALLS
jgi:hypothetical protein